VNAHWFNGDDDRDSLGRLGETRMFCHHHRLPEQCSKCRRERQARPTSIDGPSYADERAQQDELQRRVK
jgi:hypothetical protein